MILGDPEPFAGKPELSEPAARDLLEAFASAPRGFRPAPDREGLDLALVAEEGERPARARVKIFAPKAGTVLAWFYKDSQVHFSTDRFSYGAVVLKGTRPGAEETAACVDWISSGLHPERRPRSVRRAFPFTIPR